MLTSVQLACLALLAATNGLAVPEVEQYHAHHLRIGLAGLAGVERGGGTGVTATQLGAKAKRAKGFGDPTHDAGVVKRPADSGAISGGKSNFSIFGGCCFFPLSLPRGKAFEDGA